MAWFICLFFTTISLSPPIFHYIYIKNNNNIITTPEHPLKLPELTIFLPVKNESKLIHNKLSEIIDFDYPKKLIRLLIIDSGSSDDTAFLASEFLSNYDGKINWEIISEYKPGKSIAVNLALEKISTDFFVMLDADASTPPNSLKNLVRWFKDPKIGAICGQLGNPTESDLHYRKHFNFLRVGESAIDSTPIFEGSICAFRMASLGSLSINPEINADDSQLAIKVRNSGFRAIMDPEVKFFELRNESKRYKRSLRRSQGLSRVFWENKKLCFGLSNFSRIYRQQFYFYILFPWFFLISLSLLLVMTISGFYSNPSIGMEIFSFSMVLFSLILMSRLFRGLIRGALIIVNAHLLLLFGFKMNIWKTN